MGERAVAPVVGKALEIGIVLVYVSLVAGALYGSVVPDARTTAADEVADRVLADAAAAVEGGVPAEARRVRATIDLSLPERIHGETYTIRGSGHWLVLEHPRSGIGDRHRLALPAAVTVRGAVGSHADAVVRVRRTGRGLVAEVTAR